jgi:hypothetical protein
MRRWKMTFDRHGDVLRCKQLDGPALIDGQELIVIEERELPSEGGGFAGGTTPKRPHLPGGDSLPIEQRESIAEEIDPAREREPITA